MAKINHKAQSTPVFTHEGAPAYRHTTAEDALRRSVLSCLLWENTFYEGGVEIADRITTLSKSVPAEFLASLAMEARNRFHLRHVPLLLLTLLAQRARGTSLVSDSIERTIQRADELTEFLAVYAKINGRTPDKVRTLSAQVKIGLARAFKKFSAYQLAKYDRKTEIKLRDVLRLCRPTPDTPEQAQMWGKLIKGELESPDTWEVALSAGADKNETFTRLLTEEKLGYLALLRNLRNMAQSGVDPRIVKEAILARRGSQRVLPFRYVAAARAAPQFEQELDQALVRAINDMPRLSGITGVLVDVSGSMRDRLSAKSDMTRMDAACALASMISGDARVFSFSNHIVEVPPRRGMAGIDAIQSSQLSGGTYLGMAVHEMNRLPLDRLIVITDEQSHDHVPDPVCKRAYMINVASAKNGIGYGKWTHIDGFSEQIFRFIHEHEASLDR